MITPHDIYGITITGADSVDGIHPSKLDMIFRWMLSPLNNANTHWYVEAEKGIPLAFLRWIPTNTLGFLHVVTPYTKSDIDPEIQTAIALAIGQMDDVTVSEMEMDKSWPEPHFAAYREMVDHSQFVVSFPHESKPSIVANYTLGYAVSLGIPRLTWPVGK